MIATVVDALHELAVVHNASTIAELRPSEEEVAELSGPGGWTRAVLKELSEAAGRELSWRNFTGMEGPRVWGDVLVLPVGGFGTGRSGLGSV